KVLAVHVLSEIEYDIQHIPGSVNIPIHKMKTIGKLPKDKNTPLIFYCMGRR
ncbi:MAG: rhodanese-like domain-containing protein, partial [Deltaproteobacteria bacterium]|nr:rhodanese-like domain-containing protein [Deltaproteobacteria bacterium]